MFIADNISHFPHFPFNYWHILCEKFAYRVAELSEQIYGKKRGFPVFTSKNEGYPRQAT